MDDASIERVLSARDIHCWLKPHGDSKSPPDMREQFTEQMYRIGFAKAPTGVEVGDVLIVYRVGISALQYVAECQAPWREAMDEEVRREPWRSRWRWLVEARNLTPEFGRRWARHLLKPFPLAREYNDLHPHDFQRLGALNYSSDKLRILHGFASFILKQIKLA